MESRASEPDLADNASERLVVTEAQIQQAMRHYEQLAGPGDGVAICREVSKLADLLGAMWFANEKEASLPAESDVARLLAGALGERADAAESAVSAQPDDSRQKRRTDPAPA